MAAEFTAKLQDAYQEQLRDPGVVTPEGSSFTREQMKACLLDLRVTAAVLASAARDEDSADWREALLTVLARPRALEVEAVAERLERCLTWVEQPLPADLVAAAVVPEVAP